MTNDHLIEIAKEAILLSELQEKKNAYKNRRVDNGKRDPHSLYQNMLYWAYPGIIMHQFGLLQQCFIAVSSDTERRDRRIKMLSIIFSFIRRFCAVGDETSDVEKGTSVIKERGIYGNRNH